MMTDVSCALILDDNYNVLVAQRSAVMRLPLKWEFPGGKIEEGETAEECLIRELMEELGVKVEVTDVMLPSAYNDGMQSIRLFPFLCRIVAGEIILHEHAAYLWLPANELTALDWAAADIPVLEAYLLKLFPS
ncbi:(deoxy)nucleoside triphosphate pyrophosphohydrolase [Pedobacter sp. MR2016-24]|uniref:(deoxy)nucleoside triphosphate pyrophosphohydrolase n=1 Tax=Pedobacter sp. MR2016-24 TaxID=2994466 RepID=UPI00224622D4|nr:(deoxy)nucleoside triphosphate pyrophosphohydrolase [Pedobacter sp. MR2016-24]MCX2482942.1 (deoxy)nucleoside triphosphate pyrophosphohydrolase [Pedobacter sp. MR2016-24]